MIEPFFKGLLKEVIERIAVKSGATIRNESVDDIIMYVFGFGKYEVLLSLFPTETDNTYKLAEFRSTEAVQELGLIKHLPAYNAVNFTVKPHQLWFIYSVPNLISLFESHTRWSKFFGFEPVFVTE